MIGKIYGKIEGPNFVEKVALYSASHDIVKSTIVPPLTTGHNSIKQTKPVAGGGFPYTLPFTLS